MTVTIYHNPRCSKSRETLALLQERGLTPQVVAYLDQPPSPEEIRNLLKLLALDDARALMRKGEAEYAELGLDNPALDQDALIAAMASHPRLIERPIVVNGDQAALGRPPEKVLAIL
ncbi:MAG TPA: arsenate reductase (glutaredoxin) [Azonexus sp.]|nr:arsenate reductase (glutaredoxin) [Azonexus sp.]